MYQNERERLEANIADLTKKIEDFNSHFLSHKHLINGFAVVIMALIFLGMLVKAIEVVMWGICGVLVVALVVTMLIRQNKGKQLDAAMQDAVAAMKEYKKGRRKKK